MRPAIVVRYEPKPRMESARDAFEALTLAAKLAAQERHQQYLARRYARACRDLIAVFGVRLSPRIEISVEQQDQNLAWWRARQERNRHRATAEVSAC